MDAEGWPDAAWGRLRRWHERRSYPEGAALDALSDVGTVRRRLDESELAAVRAARERGKSWAEIATRLGVTRQSAWERWRDLDDEVSRQPADEPVAAAVDELVHGLLDGPRGRSSRQAPRALVVVPDVIGLEWETARRVLTSARLVAASADPDGPPLPAWERRGDVVVDQKPAAGERVQPGSSVALWLGRGPGSAGVREPLRPHPSPRSTGGAIDEQTGEPVP